MTHFIQAFSAFTAGLGTSLSPCVYPMIPITVGYLGSAGANSERVRGRVISFFVGQVLTFTLLGVVAVILGEMMGFSSEIPAVQITTGILLLVFAYISFFNKLPGFLYRMNSLSNKANSNTLLGAFLVGASSAAVASPCTSPVVGGMLTAISQVNERLWGMTLMFFFALGMAFLFLLIGLGLAKINQLPKAGLWMTRVHKLSSVMLALGGGYFIAKGFHVV